MAPRQERPHDDLHDKLFMTASCHWAQRNIQEYAAMIAICQASLVAKLAANEAAASIQTITGPVGQLPSTETAMPAP